MRRPRFIDPFEPAEVRRLVREFGSPLLILDCERVRAQWRALSRALPRVDLHYALKPMPHPALVQTVIAAGGFLDLATTGEVQLVERLGVAPERCIHTHPIKRPQDIANALQFGVRTFVADNPDEVRKFARLGGQVQLLLRVSFRAPGAVCDLSRKFGCDPEDVLPLARLAAGLRIGVRGLSFHVGSQTASATKHVEALEVCARLLAAARRPDRGLMLLSGGLGLQLTGAIMGEQLRHFSRRLLLTGTLLEVTTGFLCLYIWWRALGVARLPAHPAGPGGPSR